MTVVQELTGLDTAVDLGAERLLSLQHPDGWWKGELESNATMIAEHLVLLHFLGLRDTYQPTPQQGSDRQLWDVDFAISACIVVRRSAFESIGGFDERFFSAPDSESVIGKRALADMESWA